MRERAPYIITSDPLLYAHGDGAFLDVKRACENWLRKRGILFDTPTQEKWHNRTAASNRKRHAIARAKRTNTFGGSSYDVPVVPGAQTLRLGSLRKTPGEI